MRTGNREEGRGKREEGRGKRVFKIDFHVHVTPPEITANWEKVADNEPHFSLLFKHNVALQKSKKFASAEDVISELDNSGFDKAVVFGFAFCDMGLCRLVNDYVITKVKEYPEKLTGFCVVPPCKEAAEEINRCYEAGLKGVGELFPFGQNFSLEDETQTRLITDACNELGLPLLLHVNEPVGHEYAGKTQVPLKHIETFVKKNPNLKIALAHFGGGLFFYETMPEIKKSFANVYYDTAAAVFLYDERIYNAAKAMGVCNKILFGSDFPLMSQSRYMDAINGSLLYKEDKQMILGDNALKLLRVEG